MPAYKPIFRRKSRVLAEDNEVYMKATCSHNRRKSLEKKAIRSSQ
jgi:hypothetical protein